MGRPGLVGTMARTAVVAGTATAVSGNVQNRQQQKAAQAEAAAPAAPAAVPADGGDLLAQLEKLASLKAAGMLSDEEFSAAKARLLGL